MKAAAEYLTPVILELGGKNPVWVDPSADLNRTARSLMWSKTTNTGMYYHFEFCTLDPIAGVHLFSVDIEFSYH